MTHLFLMAALLTLHGCASRLPPEVALAPAHEDCASWSKKALNRYIDARTDSRVREGNRAQLLVNGAESWRARLELAAQADLILVKTFIWADDEVGRATAEMLSERARAGARVIVQYDIKGSSSLSSMLARWDSENEEGFIEQAPLFLKMERAGVQIVPVNMPRNRRHIRKLVRDQAEGTHRMLFASLSNFDHFDHEKYWITGHRDPAGGLRLQAILGGLNIASEYAYGGTDSVDPTSGRGGWRDTDVLLEGPVVLDILDRFFDVLELNTGKDTPDRRSWESEQARAGDARVRFVWSQPRLGKTRSVERLYRRLARSVPEGAEIRLETAYFAPGPRLRHTLEGAVENGRHLSLLTNSQATLDVPLVGDASRAAFARIRRVSGTAHLHEWRPQPGMETLHSKVASFGACGPAIVGSANLDGLSTVRNSEGVVAIEDPAFRAAFDAMFEQDLTHTDTITAADIEAQGWLLQLWQRAVYRVAWSWIDASVPWVPSPL